MVHHTQTLQVVLKAAKVGHAVVERILSGVPKRCVAQVMGQRNGFDQVFVEPQRARHRAAELRHLQRVGQARAKQVALVVQKHLGFIYQTPKCRAVHDAVTVSLVVGARWRRRLRKTPTARAGRVTGVGGQ